MAEATRRLAELSPAKLELLRRRLRKKAPAEEALPKVVADPEARHEPFPLTDVQQAYWLGRTAFFEMGNVGAHGYTEIDFPSLDVERLGAAWRRLIDHHEMLRAVFLPDGRQRVLERVPRYELELLDLRGRPDEEAAEELAAIRTRMSHQVMPAESWPLFELRVTRLGSAFKVHLGFDILIADLWSYRMLVGQLQELYAEPEKELPALEVSFRDYVLAERSIEGSERYRRAEAYWRERLAELPPAPRLPLGRDPASLARPRFRRRRARVVPAAWHRLKARASRSGLTPSGLLLAAYAETLAAWSRRPAFTLNVTLFNRLPLHPQVDQLVGDFTSLTLLAVDAAAGGSFEARARGLQEQLWRDLEHRSFSAVRVLRELARRDGIPVGRSQMPIVFTSALFEDDRSQQEAELPAGGAVVRARGEGAGITQTPQVWLDHQVREERGSLYFSWDAVEELFPAGLLDAMFEAYCDLLERLLREETWSAASGVPAPAEQLELRAAINATAAPEPPCGLHELFERRAAEQPGRPAVIAPGRRLSYGELRRLARGLGRALRERGCGAGRLVAVVMEKGWEQVAAVLGVLEAGAAYLPIDAALPAERVGHLLERGEVAVALTQSWVDEALAWPGGVERLRLDTFEPRPEEAPPAPSPGLDALAYVIFTSGSTGRPKGVMIDHRGAVNTVLDVNRRFAVGPEDRVLGLSSLSFDLSVYDVFGTLAAGAALVLPEASAGRDPERWCELITAEGVTVWNTVPALLELLVEVAAGAGAELGSLRLALLSGDWIPLGLPGRLRDLAGELEVISLGGATEGSIWSILYPIGRIDPAWSSIPYGRPMDNQSIHVLDHRLEPRPTWVTGDLYIGGMGVALGYWRDPERTAASFLRHPRTGERLYRTGDLGRYLPSGDVELLGREDLQVKLQGHRIELSEIESHLERHPAVRAAAVVPVGEARAPRHLEAFVVFETAEEGGAEAVFETLRRHLGERLPDYMVPAAWSRLEALPLTANGKVDRRALHARSKPPAAEPPARAAATPMEAVVAAAFAEVLGVETVDPEQSFFQLGGDSLLAMRAILKLRQDLDLPLPMASLFQAPTAAELAARAEAVLRERAGAQPPPLERAPRDRPLPLSFAQERLFFLDRLRPGDLAYNLPFHFQLVGELDPACLEASFAEIFRRHEVLRTTFDEVAGAPVQVVAPYRRPALPLVDLGGLAADHRRAETRRLAQRASRRRFDLRGGPLCFLALVRLEAEEHAVLLAMHHVISDDWSMTVFAREAGALYAAAAEGRPSPLPELPLQYADFACWQRGWLRGEVLAEHLGYWRRQLGDPRELPALPTDRPRRPGRRARGGYHGFGWPAALTDGLRTLSRRRGATLYMSLLALYQSVLAWLSGADRAAVGTSIAERSHPALEGLIGFFVNTLVLRTDLGGDPTFEELLERVREVCLGAFLHAELPFERLVEELQPERSGRETPFFNAFFVLRNAAQGEARSGGLRIRPLDVGSGRVRFDLLLSMVEGPGGLSASLQYDADLYLPATAARLAAGMTALAERVVAEPGVRLGELRRLLAETDERLRREQRREYREGRRQSLRAIRPAAAVASDPGDRR